MSRSVRGHAGDAPDPVPGWWLAVCAAAAMAAVTAVGLGLVWKGAPVLGPLLAIPVVLAGIGAPSLRLPLAYGAVMLAVTVALAPFARGAPLWLAAPASVAAAAVLSAAGVVLTGPGRRERAGITPGEPQPPS